MLRCLTPSNLTDNLQDNMGRSSLFPIADKALDGELEARLRAARAAGRSFADISRELHNEGVPLSAETVRVWCRDLGIERRAS
jgi:hypothetical protein